MVRVPVCVVVVVAARYDIGRSDQEKRALMTDRPSFLGQQTRTSLFDIAFRSIRNEHTKRAYMGAWKRIAAFHGYESPETFLARLAHESKAQAVTLIHEWRDDMSDENKRPNTIAQNMRAISSVLDNLHALEAFPYTVKKMLKSPKPNRYTDVSGVSPATWSAMLGATDQDGFRGVRDRAVLLCLHDVMLRRAELARLKVEHWHRDRGPYGELQIKGKGRDDFEFMPVTSRAHRAIQAWKEARASRVPAHYAEEGWLFAHLPLHKKKAPVRMSEDAIVYTTRRTAKEAGVKETVSPHRLRHAGGTFLARQGVHPEVLMRLMRHRSMETTMVYVRRASTEYADALQIMEEAEETAENGGENERQNTKDG